MSRTLDFTDSSPRSVKVGDTSTQFTLICGDDHSGSSLADATAIVIKLGNSTGYLKEQSVDVTAIADPEMGEIPLNLNNDFMTKLTSGNYMLEVWVTSADGTAIYPSEGTTGFTISQNIEGSNGSTITTITFDDFVDKFNEIASTIKKGDKGDTGPVGPAGKDGAMNDGDVLGVVVDNVVTGAPNLIQNSGMFVNTNGWNTGGVLSIVKHSFWKNATENILMLQTADTKEVTLSSLYYPVKAGHAYTAQFDGFRNSNVSSIDFWFLGRKYGSTAIFDKSVQLSSSILLDTSGAIHISKSFLVPEDIDEGYIRIDNNGATTAGQNANLYLTNIKLAEENIASPWAPSPEDKVTDNHDGTITVNGKSYVPADSSGLQYTSIPNGTDVFTIINNTGNTQHLCVNSNAAAMSLLNCPVTTVFMLDIKTASPANRPTGSAGNPTWVYNTLELHPYQSSEIYSTAIETDGNGAIVTHPWKKLVTQNSGTLDVEPAFYKSGTTSSAGALNYVLTGNVLHVSGAVSPSTDLDAGAATVLFNLPSSIGTIAENVAAVQQSSGWNLYCLSWNPNGAVSAIKHNSAGTATAITTTTQLQVSADILLK